jgi:hypothetical protein
MLAHPSQLTYYNQLNVTAIAKQILPLKRSEDPRAILPRPETGNPYSKSFFIFPQSLILAVAAVCSDTFPLVCLRHIRCLFPTRGHPAAPAPLPIGRTTKSSLILLIIYNLRFLISCKKSVFFARLIS